MDVNSQETLPENVRTITTLGHVDHGKTTLMDALLAANNIISSRMAGKMRYLDSREDEQERGITMESSAVSLKFQVMERTDQGVSPKSFLINVVDTPGHVDFSSEVSAASRLCDGALILVDVVEGVCTQTTAVLRQAWLDRLRPILVINKLDRLITELKLAPLEAYRHLSRLIEQVNAVMGSFFAGERMEDDLRWREQREKRLAEQVNEGKLDPGSGEMADFEEREDDALYFAPEKGNVIFASALDGWGFRVSKFAQLYATKLGMKEANLRRVLWGDFYLDSKTKKVIGYKHLKGRTLKPLFVQFVLDNIWAVYEAIIINPNSEKVSKIVSTLALKILPRDLKSKDSRNLLSLVFTQWLSLSNCIVQTTIDAVPAPYIAQKTRVPKMIYPDLHDETIPPKNKLEEDVYNSKSDPGACVVAYVSKMFSVSGNNFPEKKRRKAAARNEAQTGNGKKSVKDDSSNLNKSEIADDSAEEILLGFARLFSGVIVTGTRIYALLPKYISSLGPNHPSNSAYVATVEVEALYVMMGRELELVESVKAGNIFAIKGLAGKVWRSATLCAPNHSGIVGQNNSTLTGESLINLGGVKLAAPPIVRVALEPANSSDMPKLVNGLKLLAQSDPCVQTFQQETGEHVILAAGELHLERCLKDLQERFAKIQIQASKPIVPFRETAVAQSDMPPPKDSGGARGVVRGSSSSDLVKFKIRAIPAPRNIIDFILENYSIMKNQQNEGFSNTGANPERNWNETEVETEVVQQTSLTPEQFRSALREKLIEAGGEWESVHDKIWAFGPQKFGGCLLIDSRKREDSPEDHHGYGFDSHIEAGFQLATLRGPLCAEPVEGIAYFFEELTVNRTGLDEEIAQNRLSQVTGSLTSAFKDACGNGLLDWSPRLMLAMYTCDIQASAEVLGKVHGVVAKRRGRITAEEMKEGTVFFTVTALLPVVESFGFADDIRKKTSGAASPQLVFSGYEILDQDPFWVPTTEEELEDLGDKADRINVAKTYMDGVRERKGMWVDRKLVEFAEKQRTLKR